MFFRDRTQLCVMVVVQGQRAWYESADVGAWPWHSHVYDLLCGVHCLATTASLPRLWQGQLPSQLSAACLYWQCLCMQSRVLRPSICPSVRLFHPAVKCRCCKFAAGGPVGRKYRLIAAWPAHSSSCAAAVAYGGQTWGVPRCQLT